MLTLVGNGLAAIEQRLAALDEIGLRLVAGIGAAAMLSICPIWVAPVLGWCGVLRYAPRAIRAAREHDGLRAAVRAAQSAAAEARTALDEACERIAELERDLAAARAAVRPAQTPNPLYHRVGLHEGSPTFLIQAARKAFRARLHPDRHPRYREQAHERFVEAEEVFARIFRERGIRE
ncbi:J domain-containing protein [Methylobacterium sp. CM6257]